MNFFFFKYGTDTKWHGPGRIVAIDNKMIYIKYGRVVIHTSEPRVTKTALGTRFDNNGEVPREQEPTHENSGTRRQQSAARATANTTDSDDDTDLEPEVVFDTQNAPSADHETCEHAVGDAQGDSCANEDPDTHSIEATNSSEATEDTRNQSFSSDPECGLPGPNLNTSGSNLV